MNGDLAAVILAAGCSSRMGAFKPLLPFGETTLLERAIALFRDAGLADVRVVVGHRADELLLLLESLQVRPLHNERHAQGMFSSVVTAVESFETERGGFFLLPVDFPLIRPETVTMLARAWEHGAGQILYPACRGRRGHPPLLATAYRGAMLSWQGAGGLQTLLRQYAEDAVSIETGDEGILLDVDTPEDYARLRAAL